MSEHASGTSPYTALDDLEFDNRFVSNLPGDKEQGNYCRPVEGAYYSLVKPTATAAPKLVAYSDQVAELLDLSAQACDSDDFAKVFSGNQLLADMIPFAMCYGGHQFGNWAGQLGDGRAINLGEIVNQGKQRWTLQLKGAGLTPYSRNADGLAVLRSSVREFLCSEAMHHLGVPTTRALSLVLTGDQVMRDVLYDGNPSLEPGAVVCRVAPSFLRFGSFQLPASRGDLPLLSKLLHYTIETDFPHLGPPNNDTILKWFAEVSERTLTMVIHWMRVGFVHGVMNTDNMSILGLTIDYGPYGWLENYDPDWTPNTTDSGGRRYRYGHQPQIAHWNLLQLANTILPVIEDKEGLEFILKKFATDFEIQYQAMQLAKLGLESQHDGAQFLVAELLALLKQVETDMTLFYRQLASLDLSNLDSKTTQAHFKSIYYRQDELTPAYWLQLDQWVSKYKLRCEAEGVVEGDRKDKMNAVNPLYVLRNYLAQVAIDKAEQGDFSGVEELLSVLQNPYTEQEGKAHLAGKRPDWARDRVGCSMLSCSS
ncbi:MAG: hypothetical protein COB04_10985 [Gammaproteobacteria bacterium]|nr:MAG: hypothetical protein COB04_10985 [Gammaproteobacteria bacterium]